MRSRFSMCPEDEEAVSIMIFKILLTGLLLVALPVAATTLKVDVTGIESAEGDVIVTLHNRRKTFPDGRAFRSVTVPADPKGVAVSFDDLEPGVYAVGVVHDLNRNGHMDTSVIGIPKEPWGVSGKRTLRKPTFSRSKFRLTGAPLTLTIEVD